MEINIECFGSLMNNSTTKTLILDINATAEFDYYGEKIIVKVLDVDNEFFTVKLSRPFCYDENGIVNLSDYNDVFKFPYSEDCTIALPLYDASYKLKFSVNKESI